MSIETTQDSGPKGAQANKVYNVPQFEGPLDLLLYLIKKNEVNIHDIPIAEITEQFIAHIETQTQRSLEELTDFYQLAATLLLIKSKALLPISIEGDEDEEDPRKDLVERLIEHQKYKKLSVLMAERVEEDGFAFDRQRKQEFLPFDDQEPWEQLDVWDLVQYFEKLMAGLSNERIVDIYEEVSVNEKVTLMNELLQDRSEILFTQLLRVGGGLMDAVCAFLAILESVKIATIRIEQHRFFGDIRICKRVQLPTFVEEGDQSEEGG